MFGEEMTRANLCLDDKESYNQGQIPQKGHAVFRINTTCMRMTDLQLTALETCACQAFIADSRERRLCTWDAWRSSLESARATRHARQ